MQNVANQRKIGALLSYLQTALSVIIGLSYTPVMIRILGQSEYGLYSTVSSTISLLSIVNLGFNNSYIRYYAKYKQEGKEEEIYKLNGLFVIIFSVISLIALLAGLFLTFNLKLVFDKGLTDSEYALARILMAILTVNLALSFPMSIFSNIISANERFILLKSLGILKTVVGPLVTLPLLLIGYRSVAMVTVSLSVSVFTDVLYFIVVKCKLKQKFIFHSFEKGLFSKLFTYTGFIAINMVVEHVNWNVDKFLLGRFCGTTEVAIYNVGYLLFQYYMVFSLSIAGVFTPKIHAIVNQTADDLVLQKQRLTDLFVRVGRIQFMVLSLVATGVVFFGQGFIYFWVGTGYEKSYYVALLLMIPATIDLIQNCAMEIQRALDRHRFKSYASLVMAGVNLILSIFLCQRFGSIGAVIGTSVSFLMVNGIVMNIYYHKRCNIDVGVFWKQIARMTLGLLIPVAVGTLIFVFAPLYNVGYWILFVAVYCIVYMLSVWCLSLNQGEKALVLTPIRKILKRK